MFSGGPSLSARLAHIQHMPVLIASTIASEKPTDGYLVKDIIKMSYESPQTRAFLQQYLLNQLITSRNVYVKRKVLKLIEELLEKGHIEFKQNLRKQPEPLNEASRLRASQTKDGGLTAECGRIRDLANKLLEMLYSDAPELQRKRYPSPEYRPPQEEGSGSGSATRMEGFGNTSYSSSRGKSSSTTTDKLKALFGSSTKTSSSSSPLVYDQSYATMDPVPHNMSGSSSSSSSSRGAVYGGYTAGVSHAPGRYLEHGVPSGAPHRSGEAGGGWGRGGGGGGGGGDSSSTQPSQPLATQPVVEEDTLTEDTEDREERNTEQERRVVDDITAPGGVKAAPPRDSLNTFISKCKVLDCLAIVEFLRQKLREEQSQVVLRTLFVVEAMLRSDIPDIFSFLDLILEELDSLTHSTNSSIKAKATKILHQLAAEAEAAQTVTSSNTGSGVVGVAPGATTGAILDLGGGDQELTGDAGASVSNLFSGMSVSGQPPSSSAPPTSVVRPAHTHGKKTSPRLAEKGRRGGKREEEASHFGDLLGLSSTEEAPPPPSQPPTHQPAPAVVSEMEEEHSLMDLGDDKEDFDPLMRTASTGSRSHSFTRSSSLGNLKATPTSPLSFTANAASDGIMSQLSGLDLSLSPQATQTGGAVQNGLQPTTAEVLQPFNIGSSLVPMSSSYTPTSSVSGPAPPPAQPVGVIMGAPGHYGGVQMTGQMAYMPGSVPYGMQPAPAVGQQGVAMYAAAPTMMYMNQPHIGGDARPVQRPPAKAAPETSFDFLSKSSKGSAFDFVREEIDSAKKK